MGLFGVHSRDARNRNYTSQGARLVEAVTNLKPAGQIPDQYGFFRLEDVAIYTRTYELPSITNRIVGTLVEVWEHYREAFRALRTAALCDTL